ncbi:ATP-binding protein [Leeuwenhoekiella sp. MAR_2009_132]|uniref:tetratricopeptide repeat-containing sensor histidine kinase n=1 Tax=Leeuwenhoekiella sp. MAR_2009_132 TaxID=1392489 RepID=UPI00048F0C02|nr:ATP-binding protein [Leeuwenhoekiella sp. MAR_2009_132]
MSNVSYFTIKMQYISVLCSCISFFAVSQAFAQSKKIDSLSQLLKEAKSDTVRSDINEQIAYQYLYYKPDSTLIYVNKALQLAEKNKWLSGIAKAHNRRGTYYVVTSQYTEAILEFQKALQFYQKTGDISGLSLTYGNLASLDFYLKDFDAALENFHLSIKLLDTVNQFDQYTKETLNLSAAHREKKNLDSAVYYARRGIQFSKKLSDKRFLSVAHFNMGTAQYLINNPEEALINLNASLNQENIPLQFKLLAKCYRAKVYLDLNQPARSENEIAGLEEQIISLNDHYLTLIYFETKQAIYEILNQDGNALEYSKKYIELNKEVHNREQSNIFQNIKAKYAQEERVFENELLRNESEIQALQIERQKYTIYAVIIIAGLLLILIFILYRLYKFKSENNQILKEKQEVLNASNQDLEAINRQKDNLFSIVAHDVKSPVAAILNSITLLNEDHNNFSEPEIQQLYKELKKQTSDLYYLIENVLVWAKSQMNGFRFNFKELVINEFIEETLEIESIFIARKKITVVNHISKDAVIYTDPQVLRVLLRNLINNAVKFTPVAGQIRFSNSFTEGFCNIHITDTGQGMTVEMIKKVLIDQERHTLKGTANEPGNGIGLILCQEIAGKIGGRIEAQSVLGEGSTFTLVIPSDITTR